MKLFIRLKVFFGCLDKWEHGLCRGNIPARRHRVKGNVQFVIWKEGEQGYKEEQWIDFNEYWWNTFIEDPNVQECDATGAKSIN